MKAVHTLPVLDRPREKLLNKGVEALTTPELFSVVLGSGSKRHPVHLLAQRLTRLFEAQSEVTLSDIYNLPGIGEAKACQIMAALELVERLRPHEPELTLNHESKVLSYLFDLRHAAKEQVVGLYLNARHQLMAKEVLAIGAVNQAMITPKEVFAPIKHAPILYLILAHNHPSGDPKPSQDDIGFTQRMVRAAELMGIELLDHIIVSKETHYSFRSANKL
jgi:DNA repair protein RadC